jgi:hypothetical protein
MMGIASLHPSYELDGRRYYVTESLIAYRNQLRDAA